ncbi:TetR family transcriptional regulator [Microbispora sp. RL4-1S]|uniref:TetR family transcriptional regulator n=1 Tax=Microbispora oryzae TaxID=2806554 RepID=A0A941ASK4_9ACTN|nr:TetR/AcrR family transcriptional regulator [Microbispora oryzae]MBP2708584.1 TetR family transcriptional regulator [Microbispora oryzae]
MPTRAEQRRQTEDRILAAARKIFAERGYDRTTIRAIATSARTDPGLVMRYYGSKQALFAYVTRAERETERENAPPADPRAVPEFLITALRAKLTDEPVEFLAMLRSMLTHPESARDVCDTLNELQRQAAAALPGDDAALRVGLGGALMIGTIIGRYIMELDGLQDAPVDAIIERLRPAFEALLTS